VGIILPTPPGRVNVEKKRGICLWGIRQTRESGFHAVEVSDPHLFGFSPPCGKQFFPNPQFFRKPSNLVIACGKTCGICQENCELNVESKKLSKI
jgi:hypothetical protein